MTLRFSSGSATPASAAEEPLGGVDDLELDAGRGDEVALDLLGLARAQQPVVDEHAGQLVAHRALHERGRDGAVDAARQPADHQPVADLGPDPLDLLVDDAARRPVGLDAGAALEEVREHLLAERRVPDLGVPLHAEQAALAGARTPPPERSTWPPPRGSPRGRRRRCRRGSSTPTAAPGWPCRSTESSARTSIVVPPYSRRPVCATSPPSARAIAWKP